MKSAKELIESLTTTGTDWSLEKVEETLLNLKQTDIQPLLIQEIRLFLSVEYSRLSALLTELKRQEAKKWLELKEQSKSIKEADVKIKTTEEYIKRSIVENKMKAIEKLMASTKSQLEVWSRESWGTF